MRLFALLHARHILGLLNKHARDTRFTPRGQPAFDLPRTLEGRRRMMLALAQVRNAFFHAAKEVAQQINLLPKREAFVVHVHNLKIACTIFGAKKNAFKSKRHGIRGGLC